MKIFNFETFVSFLKVLLILVIPMTFVACGGNTQSKGDDAESEDTEMQTEEKAKEEEASMEDSHDHDGHDHEGHDHGDHEHPEGGDEHPN